jgi:hypothetical protein
MTKPFGAAARVAVLFSFAALLFPITTSAAPTGGAPAWMPLFNGRNLDGWKVKITGHPLGENFGNTFRVDNGVLRVAYDKYKSFDGRFGHLFFHKPFAHYRLRVEYRFLGAQIPGGPPWAFRNSGVMIHSEPPEGMARDQKFPTSLEVQLLGGKDDAAERPTGNVCTPGTIVSVNGKPFPLHCLNSISKTFPSDQWVTAEVEVRRDGTINHFINGELVLSYKNAQLDDKDEFARKRLAAEGKRTLEGGYIALQSESHPVEFRKVEIQDLDAK